MPILGTDQFDRSAATLGGSWSEIVAGPLATNMSTDGASARIDSAPAWHLATLAGTLGTDHFLQCWLRSPNSSNNAGLVWKYQDQNNFYFSIIQPTVGVRLFRRAGGVTSGILDSSIVSIGTDWVRMAVNHVGNRISIYINQLYDTSAPSGIPRMGPVINFVDGSPLTGTGVCGITSSGNNATGGSGPSWNDFCCRDGGPDTIYVDLDFNGGVVGEGWGSVERPDLDIDWALNNCGVQRGSKIKLTNAAYTDAGAAERISIGHVEKFSSASFSFPTYDPDNGRVVSAGLPNLIIEGRDTGSRTQLNEITANKPFIKLRDSATGVLIRGVDFILPGNASAAVRTGSHTVTDHSVMLAKCILNLTRVLGQLQANTWDAEGTLQIQTQYCYFRIAGGTNTYFDDIKTRIRRYISEFCIYKGVAGGLGALSAAIDCGTEVDPQAGDAWRIAHCDFIDIYRNLFNDACFAILDAAGFLGSVDYRDNIHRGANGFATTFGVYTGGGVVGGLVSCHHNGYHNITTPRDIGATDTGNEITGDPLFTAPTTPFLWPHTAGQGLNGEGTFTGITLDGDYRPTNSAYLKSASDSSTLGGVLDRGALQNFIEPGTGGGGEPDQGITPETYCTDVIYDPGGADEYDLGPRLLTMRAIRQEKDILLRQYRANDIDMDFMDHDDIFSPTNLLSFLRDPATGLPNWFGKPVIVRGRIGNAILHEYLGFLLGVSVARGFATMRLGNRFQYLFQKPVLANDVGRLVSTTNAVGSPAIGPPPTGSYLARSGLAVNTVNSCKVEDWTFTFVTGTDYYITGSVTGFDGYGSINNFTTSISGAITVGTAGAGGWNGAFAAGNKVRVATVFRSFPWGAGLGRFVEQVYKHFLLSAQGAGLTASDLDPTIDTFIGTIADQLCRPFLVDRPTTVLDAIDQLSRHMGGVTIEKANRKIGFSTYLPRTVLVQDDILCKSDDVMSASFDHAQIYNEFEIAHTYDEANQEYTGGFRFPRLDVDNASLAKYGRRLPAPSAIELRCYTQDRNSELIDLIAALNYIRFSDPRIIGAVRVKLSRLGAELDDLYRLESALPNVSIDFVEPYAIEKKLTDDLTVQMDIIDVSDLVTLGTTGCGFMVYDGPHTYDDCWFYL